MKVKVSVEGSRTLNQIRARMHPTHFNLCMAGSIYKHCATQIMDKALQDARDRDKGAEE